MVDKTDIVRSVQGLFDGHRYCLTGIDTGGWTVAMIRTTSRLSVRLGSRKGGCSRVRCLFHAMVFRRESAYIIEVGSHGTSRQVNELSCDAKDNNDKKNSRELSTE